MKKQIMAIAAAALLIVSMTACTANPASNSTADTQAAGTEAMADGTNAETMADSTAAEMTTVEAGDHAMAGIDAAGMTTGMEENDPGFTFIENRGYKLPVPVEYEELVVVETPAEGDVLFQVAEKASLDAAKAMGFTETDGVGELFRILIVTQADYEANNMAEVPGLGIIASDSNGNYYLLEHPTDVRIEREDMSVLNDPESDDMLTWKTLNEWTTLVPNSFAIYNAEAGVEIAQ